MVFVGFRDAGNSDGEIYVSGGKRGMEWDGRKWRANEW